MIFVDTNYFIRLVRNDVPTQTKLVKQLFQSAARGHNQLFTSDLVIFEIYWVLTSFYGLNKTAIVTTLIQLLSLTYISLPQRPLLLEAVSHYQKSNLDLEDAYHLAYAQANQATDLATFDKQLARAFKQLTHNLGK